MQFIQQNCCFDGVNHRYFVSIEHFLADLNGLDLAQSASFVDSPAQHRNEAEPDSNKVLQL